MLDLEGWEDQYVVTSSERQCVTLPWCTLQALVRGFLGRCEYRRRQAAQRAREAAALRVISPWGRTVLARCRFLALRSGQYPCWPYAPTTNMSRSRELTNCW